MVFELVDMADSLAYTDEVLAATAVILKDDITHRDRLLAHTPHTSVGPAT
jgi:hypothetical protein